MPSQQTGYRADIDGLRALAVGLVVIFHFRLVPFGGVGFMGVDIFFVISGFLITRIIQQGLDAGRFSLLKFYTARVRRLYPALLTVLAGYLVVAWFFLLPNQFRELSLEAILSQLYVINFYFWKEVSYFGLQAKDVPLLHMWSLAVEEQFYLIYPIVMMAIWRFGRPALLLVLSALVAISFIVGWLASIYTPGAAFYLLPARAWELGIGGILAIVFATRQVPQALARVAGPAGFGLIALALVLHIPTILFPGWFAALPVLGAVALILAGSAAAPTFASRLLALPPVVWVGRISYPLYLVHWPVIIVLNETLPKVSWGWRAAGLLLSVLLSWVILRYVETPVRTGRVFASARSFLALTGGVTAGLLAICALVFVSNGAPQRFEPQVLRHLEAAAPQPGAPNLKACDWPARIPCPLGPKGAPQVGILGDSHAWALGPAADIWLQDINRPGMLLFSSGCMPVLNTSRDRCRAFSQAGVDKMIQTPSIETVVLVSIWRQFDVDGGLAIGGKFLRNEALIAGFTTALLDTVNTLQNAGKSVIILDPLYAAPHPVPETQARNLAFRRNWPLDMPRAQHDKDFAQLEPILVRAEAAGARRISLIEELCASGICPGLHQGQPVFADTNHLHFHMSPYFADILSQALPAQGFAQ